MVRHNILITLGVCGTLVVCAALVSRAGQLDPPAGPIQPTMTNLQDIKTSIDNIGAALNVATPTWEYAEGESSSTSQVITLVTGSGFLHAVIVGGGQYNQTTRIGLYDEAGGGGPRITTINSSEASLLVPLNVRFENGLTYRQLLVPGAHVTVLYRPDPVP